MSWKFPGPSTDLENLLPESSTNAQEIFACHRKAPSKLLLEEARFVCRRFGQEVVQSRDLGVSAREGLEGLPAGQIARVHLKPT